MEVCSFRTRIHNPIISGYSSSFDGLHIHALMLCLRINSGWSSWQVLELELWYFILAKLLTWWAHSLGKTRRCSPNRLFKEKSSCRRLSAKKNLFFVWDQWFVQAAWVYCLYLNTWGKVYFTPQWLNILCHFLNSATQLILIPYFGIKFAGAT